MKKPVFLLFISLLVVIASCKKDDDSNQDYVTLTEEELVNISDDATTLASVVQTEMLSYVNVAFDSGKYISYPAMQQEKSTGGFAAATADGWTGPDANGWYSSHYEGVYDYTQRVRCLDSIVEYEFIISTDDGSYESISKTQYARYTENSTDLYRGYWDWTISTFGDNDISDVHWRMTFEDWNPDNGAGAFDWYWGASSNGGSYVPFYRYLNVIATDAGDELLNVKISFYDDNTKVWSFEYTTAWDPVEMPELHTCGVMN